MKKVFLKNIVSLTILSLIIIGGLTGYYNYKVKNADVNINIVFKNTNNLSINNKAVKNLRFKITKIYLRKEDSFVTIPTNIIINTLKDNNFEINIPKGKYKIISFIVSTISGTISTEPLTDSNDNATINFEDSSEPLVQLVQATLITHAIAGDAQTKSLYGFSARNNFIIDSDKNINIIIDLQKALKYNVEFDKNSPIPGDSYYIDDKFVKLIKE